MCAVHEYIFYSSTTPIITHQNASVNTPKWYFLPRLECLDVENALLFFAMQSTNNTWWSWRVPTPRPHGNPSIIYEA